MPISGRREAQAGREEGVKDRPCAILLAAKTGEDQTTAYVLPVTHSPPQDPTQAVEIPLETKRRLGLDAERSWVVVTEANVFAWPGPDLRPLPGQGPESIAFGMLPPRFFGHVRDRFLAMRQAVVSRTS
jgi:hypothetical protein